MPVRVISISAQQNWRSFDRVHHLNLQSLHSHVLVSRPIANTPNNTAAPTLLSIRILCTFPDLQFGQVIFLLLFGCPQLGQESAALDICLPHALQLIRVVALEALALPLTMGGGVATETTGGADRLKGAFVSAFGTIRFASHFGHWTDNPAPATSIVILCPHWSQLKVMSMRPLREQF